MCPCLSHTEEHPLYPELDTAFQMCLTNMEQSERITSLRLVHLLQGSWVYPVRSYGNVWPFPILILFWDWLTFAPDFPNGLSGSSLLNSMILWSLQPRFPRIFTILALSVSTGSSRAPAFVQIPQLPVLRSDHQCPPETSWIACARLLLSFQQITRG